jgi:branched-chain amino acid transport system ATP-binding protein
MVMDAPAAALLANEDIREFYLGAGDAGASGARRYKRKKRWR